MVFEDRIYLMSELVEQCLGTVPGLSDFFVPMNSFFIGGTAPYVYDDDAGKGGLLPTSRTRRADRPHRGTEPDGFRYGPGHEAQG